MSVGFGFVIVVVYVGAGIECNKDVLNIDVDLALQAFRSAAFTGRKRGGSSTRVRRSCCWHAAVKLINQ